MMKDKLIFLAAVLWLGLPGLVRATAQIPDLLIVGSDTLALFCNPLEGYFDNEHPRPNEIFGISSTNCWRGYQAYFELRQDSLFLTGIRLGSRGDSTDFYPLVKLFGDKATNKGVFAYWVNNPLISVRGKCLFYIHMGYASVYEFEEEFIVRQGMVKEKRIYDNRKSFLPFASGHDGVRNIWASDYSLLKTFVESQIDYSRLKPDDLDDCVDVSIKKVDGEGHIKKVLFERGLPSHRQKRAIRRALKKVPRYNVIYRRGKPIDEIFIIWRVAKEYDYHTYPDLDYFRHGIESEGERLLTPDEWKHLKDLADVAGVDTLHLDNDYFTSPPAIYNVEYRTVNSYHVVNDYSHPYYGGEINPLFWPYREFCKYLIHLADPSLPFDSDDKH